MGPRSFRLPRLVVHDGDMPELRRDGDDVLAGPIPDDLRRVSDNRLPVVPNRIPEPETDIVRGAHEGVHHIALIVPTLKLKKVLDQHIFVIHPPDWHGTMKVHILVKDPREPEETMLWKYLLREAGLITSETAGMLYPEEIEIGWQDEPA